MKLKKGRREISSAFKTSFPIMVTARHIFDQEAAEQFNADNRLIIADGEEIELE